MMGSVSLINGHIDDDGDYKTCDDCISCKVCHVVKLASKMMHADVLCEHFVDKDLIERQKAENERLKTHLEELADEVEDKMTYMCGCKNCIETVKRIIKDDVKPFDMYCDSCNRCKHRETEAIKEFAERLKLKVDIDLCEAVECSGYLYNLPKLIDNLVKEMVGDTDV